MANRVGIESQLVLITEVVACAVASYAGVEDELESLSFEVHPTTMHATYYVQAPELLSYSFCSSVDGFIRGTVNLDGFNIGTVHGLARIGYDVLDGLFAL